jgi:hypothetical protein
MDIDSALETYLLTQSTFTSLVARRIYPDSVPPNTKLPAVTYQRISDVKNHDLNGQRALENPMIQFTSYGELKDEVRAVTNVIKTLFLNYAGTLSGNVIQLMELINEIDGEENSADGTIRVYTEDLEYQVNYEKE